MRPLWENNNQMRWCLALQSREDVDSRYIPVRTGIGLTTRAVPKHHPLTPPLPPHVPPFPPPTRPPTTPPPAPPSPPALPTVPALDQSDVHALPPAVPARKQQLRLVPDHLSVDR